MTRWWRISTGCSSSACRRRIAPISPPISPPSATARYPYDRDGVTPQLKEINDFASVLETAIPAHDVDVIELAVHTMGGELRDLTEKFPGVKDTTVTGGSQERLAARAALKDLVLRSGDRR